MVIVTGWRCNMNNIRVEGRRWFQKTYGNTYNTVRIFIDGEPIVTLPEEYGYGSYYMQRATEWLRENGYTPGNERPFLSHWCRDNDVTLYDEVQDVSRERGLHHD